MKQPDFLHVDTNSHKLKVGENIFGWAWQKWVWLVWSQDSKADVTQESTDAVNIFS